MNRPIFDPRRHSTAQQNPELALVRASLKPPAHLLPVTGLAYACMLPRDLTFEIAEISFSPIRLIVLLMVPALLVLLNRQPIRLSRLDLVLLFVVVWHGIASYVMDGVPRVFSRGLAISIEMLLIYLCGRVGFKTHQDFQRFLILLLPGIVLVGSLLFLEAVSHRPIARPFLASVSGAPDPVVMTDTRLGLMRASGPFSHPILAGVFFASLVPLYWAAMSALPRLRVTGITAASAGLFTLSSGPILAYLLGAAAMVALVLQRLSRVPLLLLSAFASAFLLIVLQFGTESGAVKFVVRYLTLSPGSGQYRERIWEYGSIEVMNNVWFGTGDRDWVRPIWMVQDTIDAYWLYEAMKFGLPASLGMLVLAIGAIFALGRSSFLLPPSPARNMHIGIAITLGMLIFSGFTVHLWEGPAALFILLLGAAVSLTHASRVRFAHLRTKARDEARTAPHRPHATKPKAAFHRQAP